MWFLLLVYIVAAALHVPAVWAVRRLVERAGAPAGGRRPSDLPLLLLFLPALGTLGIGVRHGIHPAAVAAAVVLTLLAGLTHGLHLLSAASRLSAVQRRWFAATCLGFLGATGWLVHRIFIEGSRIRSPAPAEGDLLLAAGVHLVLGVVASAPAALVALALLWRRR